jgi:hypothetical protein
MLTGSAMLMQAAGDGYLGEMLTPVAALSRVHVAADALQEQTREDTRSVRTALLLYDARHSRPKDVVFAVGQRVLFEGVNYRVAAVEQLFDGARLHHVEVSLRG